MKSTKLLDIDKKEIIEGDKFELIDFEERFKKEFLEFFGVDCVVGEVKVNTDYIGISVDYSFYKNKKQVYNVESVINYNLSLNNALNRDTLIETYKKQGKTLPDFLTFNVDSMANSMSFSHNFIHAKKKIIEKKLLGSAREELINSTSKTPMKLKMQNGTELFTDKTYLMELSKEAKAFVLERHNTLYENEDVGDFTHLKLRTIKSGSKDHMFKFLGTDNLGLCTYFTKRQDRAKLDVCFADLRIECAAYEKELKDSGISDDESKKLRHSLWRKKKLELEESDECNDLLPQEDIFISLTSSVDVVDHLVGIGSTMIEV